MFVVKKLRELVSFDTVFLGMNRTKLNDYDNAGDVPIYSADSDIIYHLNYNDTLRLNSASKADKKLSMATNGDGSAGRNFVLHEIPFGITADRIVLTPINKNLSVEYLSFALSDIKRKYGFNRAFKALKHNLENIEIKIPVDNLGRFDVDAQKYLYEKFLELQFQKENLKIKIAEFNEIEVDVPCNYKFSDLEIDEIFTKIERGNSKYTKSYCVLHKGKFPVYSANNEIPLGYCDTYDYDGKFLTISINGLAGVIRIFSEKFSATADRVVCTPKKDVSIDYVKCVLERKLRKAAKGRKGDLGKNEFTKLTPDMIKKIQIPIPVKEDGSFDLEIQKEIASKYEQIEMIKKNLTEKIERLLSVSVE